MLDKNPEKRMTIEQMKHNEWINEGFHFSLCDEEVKCGIMGHYKVEENVKIPVSAVMYAQKLAK